MPTYYRKIIRITAEDSPNVRLGLAYKKAGKEPPTIPIVPGVLSYQEYVKRRRTWSAIRQRIGLDAQFYEGPEVLMYPPDWLDRADRIASGLELAYRKVEAIGLDTAEGGDDTTWSFIDHDGMIDEVSIKTPDTSRITTDTIEFIEKTKIHCSKVGVDAGGGGKQIADELRRRGYNVRTISFGSSVSQELKRGSNTVVPYNKRRDVKETKEAYFNKRSELYGRLRILMDPTEPGSGFGIPGHFTELTRQLSLIPLIYDKEGRLKMLPKNKSKTKSTEKTLKEILGCSPDRADALVLAVYVLQTSAMKIVAGVAF